MDRNQAMTTLGLTIVQPGPLDAAYRKSRAELQARIEVAPLEELKAKYREQLQRVEEAYALLAQVGLSRAPALSATQIGDLPIVAPQGSSAESHLDLALAQGHLLANRYAIEGLIGVGGMGAVYQAHDRTRNESVAIKVLHPALLAQPASLERFLDEARVSSRLTHPHVINVFDIQTDGTLAFMTMELLVGRTLRADMQDRRLQGRKYSVEFVRTIARQLCDALAYGHGQNIVHRDVKPENVWLTEDGAAKLMDFGIACLARGTRASASTAAPREGAVGTAYYMAPEQMEGGDSIDHRADQYAVAVILYEMLAGRVPTGKIKSVRELRKDVPASMSAALDQALQPLPADRFANIAAFEAALERHGRKGAAGLLASSIVALLVAGAFLFIDPFHWRQTAPIRTANRGTQESASTIAAGPKTAPAPSTTGPDAPDSVKDDAQYAYSAAATAANTLQQSRARIVADVEEARRVAAGLHPGDPGAVERQTEFARLQEFLKFSDRLLFDSPEARQAATDIDFVKQALADKRYGSALAPARRAASTYDHLQAAIDDLRVAVIARLNALGNIAILRQIVAGRSAEPDPLDVLLQDADNALEARNFPLAREKYDSLGRQAQTAVRATAVRISQAAAGDAADALSQFFTRAGAVPPADPAIADAKAALAAAGAASDAGNIDEAIRQFQHAAQAFDTALKHWRESGVLEISGKLVAYAPPVGLDPKLVDDLSQSKGRCRDEAVRLLHVELRQRGRSAEDISRLLKGTLIQDTSPPTGVDAPGVMAFQIDAP